MESNSDNIQDIYELVKKKKNRHNNTEIMFSIKNNTAPHKVYKRQQTNHSEKKEFRYITRFFEIKDFNENMIIQADNAGRTLTALL